MTGELQAHVNALLAELRQALEPLCIRSVVLKTQVLLPGEAFQVRLLSGVLELHIGSLFSAVTGLYQLLIGARSGALAEHVEEQVPEFPLRPLWIGGDPARLFRESSVCQAVCSRVVELGFNAVMAGFWDSSACWNEESRLALRQLSLAAEAFELKLIAPFYDDLFKDCPSLHAAFFQSRLLKEAQPSERYTRLEQHHREMQRLEQLCPKDCQLIYYLQPEGHAEALAQTEWIPSLQDLAGNRTIIAFPAVAAAPWEDHVPPHPLWENLRRSPDTSATPLMPLINAGSVRQGEGLWPTLTVDASSRYIGAMRRHAFAGALCLTAEVPRRQGLLDCSLWTAGQLQWRYSPSEWLLERWLPAGTTPLVFQVLRLSRELLLAIRRLGAEQATRTQAEAVAAQWRWLHELSVHPSLTNDLKLEDYLRYFLRDAWRQFMQTLQVLRLPLTGVHTSDPEPSFWSTMAEGGRVIWHDCPIATAEDDAMLRILRNNRLIYNY